MDGKDYAGLTYGKRRVVQMGFAGFFIELFIIS